MSACNPCDKITLPVAQDGASSFTYIAYASDSLGTGFSLNPSDSLDYVSIITTTTAQTNNAVLHTGNWAKYQGDDGSTTTVLLNDFVASATSNPAYTQLKGYSLPAGTMSVGDYLEIKINAATTNTAFSKQIQFYINGSFYTSKIASFQMLSSSPAHGITIRLNQISATTVFVEAVGFGVTTQYSIYSDASSYSTDTVAVPNMDSNALDLDVYALSNNVTEFLVIEQYSISHFKV